MNMCAVQQFMGKGPHLKLKFVYDQDTLIEQSKAFILFEGLKISHDQRNE